MSEKIRFKVGDDVTWQSQANGYVRWKTGVVCEVVPAGRRPKFRHGTLMYGPFDSEGITRSLPRNHESYLVQVGSKVYWPRVSSLRYPTQQG